MRHLFNPSYITAGFTSVFVGYTSSVAIVIHAASTLGAKNELIESWLMMLGVVLGVCSAGYSLFFKKPILMAWSTPGAALLALAPGEYELAEIVGGFLVSGLMIVLTGFISPLMTALQKIPASLGTAMLAAILLPFCLQAFEPLATSPYLFAIIMFAYLCAKQVSPKYTMLVVLVVSVVCAGFIETPTALALDFRVSLPYWISPEFNVGAIASLALPLYVVTMLSQHLPGITMMNSFGYSVPIKKIFIGSGLVNTLTAPFGVFSVNLAAISAAICMNEEVDPNPDKRFLAVVWAGGFYIVAGLFASLVVALFLVMPLAIIKMLAGLALMATLAMCLHSAFDDSTNRESALITFLFTLSGVTIAGISATLVGLAVGGLHFYVVNKKAR